MNKFRPSGYSGIQTMVKKFSLSTITTFQSLLVIVTALLLCLPISAHAGADAPPSEAPPMQKAHPAPPMMPQQSEVFGTPVAVLHDAYFGISFFQNPYISESDFTLRLSLMGTVSGCAHLQRGFAPVGSNVGNTNGTTSKYVSNRLEIMMDVPAMANSDGGPRYSTHDCETSHLESYVDIPLNRDKLRNKNISQFVFRIPSVDLGAYDFDLNEDRIIFKSKYAEDVPEVWITLWFFPQNTIKLYVPSASSNINVIKEIRDFGLAHGLIPMDEELKGYTLPHQANDYVYFVDPKRIFIRNLSPSDNNKQIGEIGVIKTYHGPNGPHERMKSLPIHGNLVQEYKVWQ